MKNKALQANDKINNKAPRKPYAEMPVWGFLCLEARGAYICLFLALLLLSTVSHADITTKVMCFFPKVKNIQSAPYVEIGYQRNWFDCGVGYMKLKAGNTVSHYVEDIDVVQARMGFVKPVKNINIIGGISHFMFKVDGSTPPQQTGGYVGLSYKYLEVRYQLGDMDIDTAIIEDESNINGLLIGFKWRW